jgi:hypothetical protein
MKQLVLVCAASLFSFSIFAQEDSAKVKKPTPIIKIGGMTIQTSGSSDNKDTIPAPADKIDTIKVGGVTVIGKGASTGIRKIAIAINGLNLDDLKKKRPKKVSTNWFVWDLGFAGYNDKTNYASAEAQAFIKPTGIVPASKGDFALKGSRVSNFNLWFFLQRVSIIESVLNLKYGLGIESNNYFFKSDITYVDGISPYAVRGAANSFTKNKLVANYLTVPLMLNINTNPMKGRHGLQVSAGVSGGYLHSSRQKQKGNAGMVKNKTDFNLEKFKLSYVGELGLGPVKLYGSLAAKGMHQYGVDQHPYTIGLRFANLSF